MSVPTGSISVTQGDAAAGVKKFVINWTADGSGNVVGNVFQVPFGFLRQMKFVPHAGVTSGHSVRLLDGDGVDVLSSEGASLSSTDATIDQGGLTIEAGALQLAVTGAGAGNSGTLTLLLDV